MKKQLLFPAICFLLTIGTTNYSSLNAQCFTCKDAPPGTIFCDDFEEDIPMDQKYFEYNNNSGDFIRLDKTGRDSSFGMRVKWQAGEVGAGGLSKSFGKTPDSYIGKNASEPTKNFDEIYWRMDVKSQEGWIGGGPDKLSRALCLANSNWAEGLMAHLWAGGGSNKEFLGMDPASGIGLDGTLKSTKYNDFPNLRWLGFKAGNIDLFSTENSGKWYCVVGHVKLNTPGLDDGVFEFWINDTLQASSTNLNWHDTWNNDPNNLKINAIFFENYWNSGSPVQQERYFDNIVISTNPIPCTCKIITSTIAAEKKSDIQISPNPTNNEITLTSSNSLIDKQFQIKNLIGQISLSGKLNGNTINIQSLPAGVYLLTVEGYETKKLVVSGH